MSADAENTRRNAALQRLLARAQWSPENLGARCNELAATLGLKVYGHPRNARRWVYAPKGRLVPAMPREPWPALICHLLHERLGEPVTLGRTGLERRRTAALCPRRRRAGHPEDPGRGGSRAGRGRGC